MSWLTHCCSALWSFGLYLSLFSFVLSDPLLRPLRTYWRPVFDVTGNCAFFPMSAWNAWGQRCNSSSPCISKYCHLFEGNSWNRWSSVGKHSTVYKLGKFSVVCLLSAIKFKSNRQSSKKQCGVLYKNIDFIYLNLAYITHIPEELNIYLHKLFW